MRIGPITGRTASERKHDHEENRQWFWPCRSGTQYVARIHAPRNDEGHKGKSEAGQPDTKPVELGHQPGVLMPHGFPFKFYKASDTNQAGTSVPAWRAEHLKLLGS